MERQGQMYQQPDHGASGNQHEGLRVSWQPRGAWTHTALWPACPAPILAPQLLQPWESYSTSLHLSFFTFKMGVIINYPLHRFLGGWEKLKHLKKNTVLIFIFICLAALGLSCSTQVLCLCMWILSCSMWDLVPWPKIKARTLQLEFGVLATGPPGKSLKKYLEECLKYNKHPNTVM